MADVKRINGYDIKDATARENISKFSTLYLVKEIGASSSLTSTFANIPIAVQSSIATILNALSANEYISIERINIQTMLSIAPTEYTKYKKGDTAPVLQLKGWKVTGTTLMFVDVNASKVVYYDITNNRPASDNVDDYTDDSTSFTVDIIYNKYQKGI